MSKALVYKQKIQSYDWEALKKLWIQIKKKKTEDWEVGKAFEYLILRAFELNGADVKYPYTVSMFGKRIEQIDGVVYFKHISCIVEAKDYTANLNIEPVAKLRNQLMRRPATTIGSMFSSSGFTQIAVTLAMFTAPQTILLWEKEEMEYVLEQQNICEALVLKYRHCVETGVPNFDITNLNLKL